jgi:hypothetical protein
MTTGSRPKRSSIRICICGCPRRDTERANQVRRSTTQARCRSNCRRNHLVTRCLRAVGRAGKLALQSWPHQSTGQRPNYARLLATRLALRPLQTVFRRARVVHRLLEIDGANFGRFPSAGQSHFTTRRNAAQKRIRSDGFHLELGNGIMPQPPGRALCAD